MGKLKQLTEEEADIRLDWLAHNAGDELIATLEGAETYPRPDAKSIEKLHEVSRVAREVANYYTNLEPHVAWEVGVEEGGG